jgi:hypothetical protein
VAYVESRSNQTFLLIGERNEYECVFPWLRLQTLEQTREHRRATPVVDHARADVHEIVVRADHDFGVRRSNKTANYVWSFCMLHRLVRDLAAAPRCLEKLGDRIVPCGVRRSKRFEALVNDAALHVDVADFGGEQKGGETQARPGNGPRHD